MPNRLIIVESPSKARTLSRFLGTGYTVKASMGHVRDLPKSRLGVDVDSGFTPQYEVLRGKEAQIKELRIAARKSEAVLLASDPDREGEAIAWHLTEALELDDPDRVVFHEITRSAVEAALTRPRKIDRDLVAAQEARRVIDRLVGYQLSPLLWKKVRTGLSAGRVQSVAVRLVVDRENEIEAFVSEESWTLEALLAKDDGQTLTARLHARLADGAETPARTAGTAAAEGDARESETSRHVLGDEAAALEVMSALGVDAEGTPSAATPRFRVAAIEARDTTRSAPAPYTTSTLQQEASTRLRFQPKKTMRIAQQLYEGVELGAEGSVGLITYMRTDSTRISDGARDAAHAHIRREFGTEYVRTGVARPSSKAPVQAQDAHEAVRPTDVQRTPEQLGDLLSGDQRRLYELIWRRFVASQMAAARFRNTRADLHAGGYVFRATGSVLVFDGFTRVLRRDDDKDDRSLPPLAEHEVLDLRSLTREQHFTQPPPRYTEASLVKELEERGIGRPSTYAPTVDVIQERNYVRQEERRLHPTELGKTVDAVLRQHFPEIVDVTFTADMEKRLDGIEGGERAYEPTVREWYDPFSQTLARAESSMERVRVPVRETGEACPECGQGQLVIREGRFGEFTGCSRYPECKYIKGKEGSAPQPTGQDCPECGKPLVVRQGRRGPFIGCSGYPSCRHVAGSAVASTAADGTVTVTPAPVEDLGACPDCGKPLARRTGRRGPFVGCTGYPSCRYIQPRGASAAGGGDGVAARPARPAPEPTGADCPDCGKPLVRRQGRFGPFISCSGYPGCRYRPPKDAARAEAVASTRA